MDVDKVGKNMVMMWVWDCVSYSAEPQSSSMSLSGANRTRRRFTGGAGMREGPSAPLCVEGILSTPPDGRSIPAGKASGAWIPIKPSS